MQHGWRSLDTRIGYEARRLTTGVYEIRQRAAPDGVVRLSPAEFNAFRKDGVLLPGLPGPPGRPGFPARRPSAPLSGTEATNPNPDRITAALWRLWLGAQNVIPGVRLGGIYADTRGYHNTRERLESWLPDNYSIQLDMDRRGPDDKASAIDLTMSDSEMRKRTGYLRRSALDPDDTRLRALREFIGTLDSERVYCRIDGNGGLGQKRGHDDWTRDSSHLWHIHISVLRAFCASWDALGPVLSVLSGETWQQWLARKDDDMPIRTSLGTTRRQPLTWEQFTVIRWDVEHSDTDGRHRDGFYPGYVPDSGGWVDAQVQVRIRGLQPGDWYQVQFQLHDWADGGPSDDPWVEIVADQPATNGDQFAVGTISKHLPAGAHLWVAVAVFRGNPTNERPVPEVVAGRWTVRQDRAA